MELAKLMISDTALLPFVRNEINKLVSSQNFSYQPINVSNAFPSGPVFGYLLLFPEGIKRHEATKASSLIKYSTHVRERSMVIW